MKTPKVDVIESDNDNVGNYYYTDEIVEDKHGLEYFVYQTHYSTATDDNGIDIGSDPISLFVSVDDENNTYDEIELPDEMYSDNGDLLSGNVKDMK